MSSLNEIINSLKQKPEVDAVFLMGSQGNENKSYSDIDMVVVLKEKPLSIKAVHTWVDRKFADIFFFDFADLNRIESATSLVANSLDAVFVSWFDKATVQFDKSGKISALIRQKDKIKNLITIPKNEQHSFWDKINYNFINNKRYFESNDPVYHDALEIRLLYSVNEVIVGYFEFRNIPWRGEKQAVNFLRDNDANFYDAFKAYVMSNSIEEKFKHYSTLVELVFTPEFLPRWSEDGFYVLSDVPLNQDVEAQLNDFWKKLMS